MLVNAPPATAQDDRPNILVIVTDDQSPFTLSCYGNTDCRTPNLDALAERGMVLDQAYHMGAWSGAVCTPSRHMIMSGRTVWHIPGRGNPNTSDAELVPPNLADQTMAAVFNRAGYVTFRTCKRGNSYEGANAQFTHRHDATRRGGTAETGSAWHGDRAVEFLEAMSEQGEERPLLMYLGFSHPHDVRDGLPDLLEYYGAYNADDPPTEVNPAAPPLPTNYLPEHPFHHGHPNLRDEVNVSGVLRSRSEATIRNETGREYACIENIDRQIGRVLEQLDAMGELDNTYILFTADHGMSVGRHGLTGKQNLYEHTWRVPMIAVGPGIAPGSRASGNTYLLDILATVCDFAGIDAPETNEGTSFAPVVRGDADTVRDVLYGVYCGGTKPGMRSVRLGDWKLIKYDLLDGEVRETQLFNLADNPEELLIEHHDPAVIALTGNTPVAHQANLADDPRYAEKRAELEALLRAEMDRLGDPYRLWDQPGPRGDVLRDGPNIILVMADDLGWGDTGYNGHPVLKTPHMDAMAGEGVTFTRFYAAAPVCSPTRGSCLTGRHPYRYGITHANTGHMLPEELTLAELLGELGYRTGHFGKWHLGTLTTELRESNRGGPRGRAHYAPPWDHGFDTCFSTEAKVPTWDPMVHPDSGEPYGTHYWSGPGVLVEENLEGDDSRIIMDRAVPFIENATADGEPFFAVVWFHTPHLPVVAGPEYRAMYAGEPGDRPDYFGCITAMDEQIGRLRATLAEHGVADNTIIFFCSDNGPEGNAENDNRPGSTAGLRGRKRSLYEGGIRVPGLMIWPDRVADPRTIDAPCCTSDYLPTLLDVLGIEQIDTRGNIDGISLLPLINGERTQRETGIGFQSSGQLAWISDRYKLIVPSRGVQPEIYDLIEDPSEQNDLAPHWSPEDYEVMIGQVLWQEDVAREREAIGE